VELVIAYGKPRRTIMRKPLYNITKTDLWVRGVFVAIAVALVIAHE
jgi:hypothetical protein